MKEQVILHSSIPSMRFFKHRAERSLCLILSLVAENICGWKLHIIYLEKGVLKGKELSWFAEKTRDGR
jgi:hypothetical protein